MHHLAGVERLAGLDRRTDILAPAAFRTGKTVKEVLPGKLVNPTGAVPVSRGKLFARLAVRLVEAPEKAVRNGGQNVHMLAAGQKDHERQQGDRMQPPEEQG